MAKIPSAVIRGREVVRGWEIGAVAQGPAPKIIIKASWF
jgi:hypothetical protein